MTEFDFIQRLREHARQRRQSPRVVAGIGDDASVIAQYSGRDLLVTTDLLVEDVDFYRESAPAHLLGHKSLAVSLSDVAAMGGRPCWSFLSLGMPRDVWNDWFRNEFIKGYLALADQFGVTLAGGDVSESKGGVVIDSIVLGETLRGQAVLRSGARAGDQIFVTGNLGGAAAGVKLIEMGLRMSEPTVPADESASPHADDGAIQSLLQRQLRPEPRVGWGIVLGEEQLATAMIDISDGLSSELRHICDESNVGAQIQADAIPLNKDVQQLCGRRALDPLALALRGGEDLELLFTVAPKNIAHLPKRVDGVPISHIGEVTNAPSVIRVHEKHHEWDLQPQGFEHFGRDVQQS
jgi:thiamine-monophosphate kinase